MNKLFAFLLVSVITLAFSSEALAKGSSGGSRGGGGSRTTTSRSTGSSGSKTTTSNTGSKTTTNTAPKAPAAPKVNTKPVAGQTKTVTNSTPKTVNGKTYSKTGNVVDDKYQPTFRGGYRPPVGSTVYYRDSSSDWMSYIPLWYIMTHNGSNGSGSQAVVVQPDGKEVEVEQEGTDGWYIFNWIVMILIALGIIGAIVYFVNKKTQRGGVKYA